jgi:hypothetical protein
VVGRPLFCSDIQSSAENTIFEQDMKRTLLLLLAFHAWMVYAANKPSKLAGPEGYIENKGQIMDQNRKPNSDVKYLLNTDGMNIQLRSRGFSYDTYSIQQDKSLPLKHRTGSIREESKPYTVFFHRIDIEFIDANPDVHMEALLPSDDYTNYYTVDGAENGVLFVRSYQNIIYHDLYPGIDLEFGLKDGKPKYNFVVFPGADPSKIKWKYKGPSEILFTESSITLKVAAGLIEETIPETFVKESGESVDAHFQQTEVGVFSFSTAGYPANTTLVIDPVPWATYYGGTFEDIGWVIDSDRWGNLLIGGYTTSTNNIASAGAHLVTFGGGQSDAMLLKFSSAGARKWATYYGGANGEWNYGTAVGKNGNIYIGGTTGSFGGIATPGSYQPALAADYDGYLARFDSTGVRVWGTYFGGNSYDEVYAMAIDENENIILTGQTWSTTGIASPGALQTAKNSFSSSDIFVFKFDSSGTRLWSTYYGDDGIDIGYGINTDTANNIVIVGYTHSGFNFSTTGAFQPAHGGGMSDGYVLKLGPNGNRIWCSFFGDTNDDQFRAVITDKAGNIYASGFTGTVFGGVMATPGAYQSTRSGGNELLMAKFTSSGSRVWSTYYGGDSIEFPQGMAIDRNAAVYLVGETNSATGFTSAGCWQPVYAGGANDGYIAKFDSSGARLWGTYYGGSMNDLAIAAVTDTIGNLFVTGGTMSTSGISRPGAYKPTFTTSFGGGDAFIAAFTGTGFLPVKLLYLNAERWGYDVKISWETASEKNSDRFDIQHSTDGENWSYAGTVEASGVSSSRLRYTFFDRSPLAKQETLVFYRLKQMDMDGSYMYSDIVRVGSSSFDQPVSVYPNPFQQQLYVKNAEPATIVQFINFMGNVQLTTVVSEQGTIDELHQLAPGIYIMEIKAAREVYRLTVQKK